MDWATALHHLPSRLAVCDRKGRVLMRTGDIPGVSVGKSILKLASKASLRSLGRAAKLALAEDAPQTLSQLFAADNTLVDVLIVPFSPSGGLPDHLLVQITEATAKPVFDDAPTLDGVRAEARTEPPVAYKRNIVTVDVDLAPAPEPPLPDPPLSRESALPAEQAPPKPAKAAPVIAAKKKKTRTRSSRKTTPKPPENSRPQPRKPKAREEERGSATPPTGPLRETQPLPKMPAARDMVLIADAGMLPIAKALAGVLTPTVKTKALPLGKFVAIFEGRAGANAGADKLETQLDPATRLVFLGTSAYGAYVRENSLRSGRSGAAGWAISGKQVRCSTVWIQSLPKHNLGDLIADAQFDIGQLCYLAVPKKRNGRRQPVSKGLALAGKFLEDPATIVPHRTPRDEAQHTLVLLAIARWLKEGFELFLTP